MYRWSTLFECVLRGVLVGMCGVGVGILGCNAHAVGASDMWARSRWDPHVSDTCSTADDLYP